MIYINFKNSKQNQFFINERATELVKYGNSNKNKNIYGNVLVLAINENNYSNISPNFINEIETFNYFKEKNSIKGRFFIFLIT